jgi:hypothetical protein
MLPHTTRAAMRKIALLLGTLALTGCAEKTIYLRTDGQDVASNPALRSQMELDRKTCEAEPGDDRDCMAVKGYVSVSKEEAAVKQQQLAAAAAQNAANDAAAAVLPPPPVTPEKIARAKKRKPTPLESTLRSSQD